MREKRLLHSVTLQMTFIYVPGTTTQLYEVCQSNEPEYSYATPHTTSTPQQSNSDVMGVSLVDNAAVNSTCGEDVHEYI